VDYLNLYLIAFWRTTEQAMSKRPKFLIVSSDEAMSKSKGWDAEWCSDELDANGKRETLMFYHQEC